MPARRGAIRARASAGQGDLGVHARAEGRQARRGRRAERARRLSRVGVAAGRDHDTPRVCRLAIGRPTRSTRSWRRWPRPRRTRGSPARPADHAGGSRVGRDVDAWESGDIGGASGQAGVEKWPSASEAVSSDDTRRTGDRARRGVSPESAWRYPCEEPYQERRPLIGLRRRGSVTHRLRRDRRVLRSGHRRRARLEERSSHDPLASEIGGCWPFVERSITENVVW